MFRLRKLAVGALCLVLSVLALAQPTDATLQVASDGSEFSYTTIVHYKASSSSAVIGQMEDGSCVTVLDESGDFYKVDCYDTAGYIAKSQISQKSDGLHYIACQPQSRETKKMEHTVLADAVALRAEILRITKRQLGSAYVLGGTRPGAFDCSGLTSYVYRKTGYSLHREADTQLQDGLIVSRENLQVGDLVFFRSPGSPWLATHVGIYVGNNQIIHASSSKGVRYSSLNASYYSSRYLCARRIVNTATSEISAMLTAASETALTRTRNVGLRTAE